MMSTANMLTANNHVMANKMSKRNISKLKSQTKGIASRLQIWSDPYGGSIGGPLTGAFTRTVFQPFLALLTFTYPILISCFMF